MADNDLSGYHYQKLNHNWLTGHEMYGQLTMADRGTYFSLILQAGRTRQDYGVVDGTIAVGAVRKARKGDVAKWLGATPGFSTNAAAAALERLKQAGLITIRKGSGTIAIARWLESQGAPPTEMAARQRKSREGRAQQIFMDVLADKRGEYVSRAEILEMLKRRISGGKKFAADFLARSVAAGLLRSVDGDSFFVEMVGSSENAGNSRDSVPTGVDSVPLLPPSISSFEGVTNHRAESVTSHQNKSQIEKDMNISSKDRNPSISRDPSFSSGGSRGTESCCSVSREDIFTKPPLDVCEALVGLRGAYDRNGFTAKLRDMKAALGEQKGTAVFRQAMEKLRADLSEPRCAIRVPARVLHANLNKLLTNTGERT